MRHWVYPLDPECPAVAKHNESMQAAYEDPMTQAYGASDVVSEMGEEWEQRHRHSCTRCQAYGAANVDVSD